MRCVNNFFANGFCGTDDAEQVLAGFAFGALCEVDPTAKDKHPFFVAGFYISAVAGMCLNLICVSNCLFLSMCGPGLALRGPDGSMHTAVEGMQAERGSVFRFFGMGVVALHLETAFLGWCTSEWYFAAGITVMVFFFLHLLAQHYFRIEKRFAMEAEDMVSSQLQMGDLDAGDFTVKRETDYIAERKEHFMDVSTDGTNKHGQVS